MRAVAGGKTHEHRLRDAARTDAQASDRLGAQQT